MVGNDVVDLRDSDVDPATLHPGFDRRVFASDELVQLAQSSDPVARRWKLWAAKESAYKALVKTAPVSPAQKTVLSAQKTIFSPIRFRVALERVASEEETQQGLVRSDAGTCRVQISLRDGAVHAVARVVAEGGLPVLQGLERIASDRPEMLSRAVRRLARRAIGARLGCGDRALEIGRDGRIPVLLLDGERQPADLSLSHHGRVVAFAFAPRPDACSVALLRKAS